MSPLPELSDEQRAEALAKAKAAREVRANVKHRLKMGLLTFDELLAEADSVENVGKLKALAALGVDARSRQGQGPPTDG